MRPLVGVTTSEMRLAARIEQTPEADPPRTEMALGLTYMRAIEGAGGIPVVIPPLETKAIRPLLERLSGVCLSGGPDLDPKAYKARPHPKLGPTEPALDRFELAVARAADDSGLPVLAICRGLQALNVARGGTLRQHVPGHRQSEPGDEVTHRVDVTGGTLLARVLRGSRFSVNSFHHQAVRRLGTGLRATAWAPDGVIEAIEAPNRAFMVGVQWHAETLTGRPEQQRLFESFVDAALAFEQPSAVMRAV
jgi:putative glutamine amidotransferase